MLLALFLLLVPLFNEKYNKLTRVARALKEENQKLRTLLTDAMLEIYSLRNDGKRSTPDSAAPVSKPKPDR